MTFEVGRVCLKIAGRDANRRCVVVETVDANFVVVDGDVRRKKVNVKHLEPFDQVLKIKNKASHDEVKREFDTLGWSTWEKKSRKPTQRPKKQMKVKAKPEVKKGKKVKAAAKVEKKVETAEKADAETTKTVEKAESKPEVKEEKSEAAKPNPA
jgi:large subunit ribosomal protein L14e